MSFIYCRYTECLKVDRIPFLFSQFERFNYFRFSVVLGINVSKKGFLQSFVVSYIGKMKNLRKQLVSWKNEFVSGSFDNVLNEYKVPNRLFYVAGYRIFSYKFLHFQSFISEESLNDEVYAASYCLIALNAEVHKISKSNLQDSPPARVIFELVNVFCESVAKSWELVTVDFSAGVFYIFKYLLDRVSNLVIYLFHFSAFQRCTRILIFLRLIIFT